MKVLLLHVRNMFANCSDGFMCSISRTVIFVPALVRLMSQKVFVCKTYIHFNLICSHTHTISFPIEVNRIGFIIYTHLTYNTLMLQSVLNSQVNRHT